MDVDWITEHVAIGNYLEAQDTELLRRHGFRSVLSLDGSLVAERPRSWDWPRSWPSG